MTDDIQTPKENSVDNASTFNPGSQMPRPSVDNTPVGNQNLPQSQVGGVQPNQVVPEVSQPAPPPKKLLSKKLLLIIPFLVLLMIFVFLFSKIKPGGIGSFGKKGEITWWGFWDKSVVEPLIREYQKDHPNITINYVTQSSQDYRERLSSALTKGSGPDIFRIHNSWIPMFSSELEPLPASVMSSQEFQAIFYPVISSDLTTSSGILGMPLGYDALTLYVNEDLLAAAGKTPPVTWDEFSQTAGELTTRDKNNRIVQAGAAIGRTENIDHWQEILGLMFLQNGVNPGNPTGQLAVDAVKFYTLFGGEKGVWDETLPPSTVAFANGKVAMYFGPSWRTSQITKMNPSLRFKTVPLPQLRKDDPSAPDVSYATYWVEGVWNKSANKEVSWDFLKFLSEQNSLETLFNNLSKSQGVGEPYPRIDMGSLLKDNKILSSITTLAPQAKSWYLADSTNDGPMGINSQISSLFKGVIDNVISGREPEKELAGIAPKVKEVLSQYGLK